jgi:hypothetical protein
VLVEIKFQTSEHWPKVKVRFTLGIGCNSKLGRRLRNLLEGPLVHIFVVVVEENSGESPNRIFSL